MEVVLAIAVGGLFATSIYMMLRRSIVKLVIGLALLTHAGNLLVFTSAGLTRGRPPLIADDSTVLAAPYADPLPQALILTAIVIGFGMLAFSLVLIDRAYHTTRTDDLNDLTGTDT